jgi:hypothetical protein
MLALNADSAPFMDARQGLQGPERDQYQHCLVRLPPGVGAESSGYKSITMSSNGCHLGLEAELRRVFLMPACVWHLPLDPDH